MQKQEKRNGDAEEPSKPYAQNYIIEAVDNGYKGSVGGLLSSNLPLKECPSKKIKKIHI